MTKKRKLLALMLSMLMVIAVVFTAAACSCSPEPEPEPDPDPTEVVYEVETDADKDVTSSDWYTGVQWANIDFDKAEAQYSLISTPAVIYQTYWCGYQINTYDNGYAVVYRCGYDSSYENPKFEPTMIYGYWKTCLDEEDDPYLFFKFLTVTEERNEANQGTGNYINKIDIYRIYPASDGYISIAFKGWMTPTYSTTYRFFGYDVNTETSDSQIYTLSEYHDYVGQMSTGGSYIDIAAAAVKEKYKNRQDGEVIFYGGSNFEFWDSLEADMAPYPTQNMGVSGTNDEDRLKYLDELVAANNPSIVYYMASSNDWTTGRNLEEIWTLKQKMFAKMTELLPDTIFAIMSATPNPLRYFSNSYNAGMVELNSRMKTFCEANANFEYIDVVAPLTTNGQPNTSIWREDQLHLNDAGYALLATAFKSSIAELVVKHSITLP